MRPPTQEALTAQGWLTVRWPLNRDLLELAAAFGTPRPATRDGPLVNLLAPRSRKDAPPRSLSMQYGDGRFPFHTDAAHWPVPPRYVVLRSVGSDSARPTLVADLLPSSLPVGIREALEYDVWLVNGGRGRFLTSIIDSSDGGQTVVRFDSGCMTPAERSFGRSAAILATRARKVASAVLWRQGEALIIDNWRVVHARGPHPRRAEERLLERVMIA